MMETIIKILGIIVFIFLLSILMAFPVMLLWNWLMPSIFGIVKIEIWQALGISILSNILFKNNSSIKK